MFRRALLCFPFIWAVLALAVPAKPLDMWPRTYTVTGTVESLEPRGGRWRLVVTPQSIDSLTDTPLPRRVQIGTSAKSLPENLQIGDTVAFLARLSRPAPPVAPGAFDYQKWLYDREIDASGFVLGKITLQSQPADRTFRHRLEQLRLDMARRVLANAPDPAVGGLAVALTIGIQGFLPKADADAMQAAGLTHLLSISGLHMTMVAGLVYIVMRRMLALTPLALKGHAKPVAAIAALVAGFLYFLLSGMSIPTQRSFLTVAIAMLAILAGRQPFSLWTVAIAAGLILLTQPEALSNPGFQMSFAAVVTLILFYQHTPRTAPDAGWIRRITLYFVLLALSGVAVTLVTSPISAWHFHRFPVYGTLANLVAIPVTGILVMPLLVAMLLVMPFGLDGYALSLATPALQGILAVSRGVAGWPFAQIPVAAFPGWAVVAGLGATVLLLLPRWWKLAALVPVSLAVWLVMGHRQPDIVISPDGRQVGFLEGRTLHVVTWQTNGFIVKNWQERYAATNVTITRIDKDCPPPGCTVQHQGKTVFLPQTWQALTTCPPADIILAPFWLPRGCTAPLLRDRDDTERDGATTITLSPLHLATDREHRGAAPWTWNLHGGER